MLGRRKKPRHAADGSSATPTRSAAGSYIKPKSAVQILFCANPGFFQHTAVAAVSLVEAARCDRVDIHVMTCEHDALAESKLIATLRPYPHVTLTIIHVEERRVAEAFVDKHLSKEAYLRFMAPECLPRDIDRVIYLDSDVVVLDDISALTEIDLEGKAVGAVPDGDWSAAVCLDRFDDLGIERDQPYVNSGVLLIDLDRWRRDDVQGRLFRFIAEHRNALVRHDQDALNAVLSRDICLIDRRWNLQVLMFSRWVKRALPLDYEASAEARRKPAILHFSTADKPWKFRIWTRKKAVYFHFLRKTAWRKTPAPHLTATQRIEHRLTLLLLRTGFDVYVAVGIARRVRKAAVAAMSSFHAAVRLFLARRRQAGQVASE